MTSGGAMAVFIVLGVWLVIGLIGVVITIILNDGYFECSYSQYERLDHFSRDNQEVCDYLASLECDRYKIGHYFKAKRLYKKGDRTLFRKNINFRVHGKQ